MTSRTRVNGVEHRDSVTVYCSDTIPMFNSDSVRQGLMAVLDSSGVFTRPTQYRIERIFFILQDTVTPGAKPFIYLIPTLPHADACQAGDQPYPSFSDRPPNTKVLAWGHDHIGDPGEPIWCIDERTGVYQIDPRTGAPIFSEIAPGATYDDWKMVWERNQPNDPNYLGAPINHFIIRPHDVITLRPGQMPNSAVSLPANVKKWEKGRCAWPKRII